ncbi:MAG: type II toxin-antitoxin system HicB family antitoxin [Clostridia bacterium]|nr:type II toxin-antitoxin system HicB family antitoxin [Clostridia bacterium]
MKSKYTFVASFHPEVIGYSVEFPQLPGCYTQGDTFDEAVKMATEALSLHLYGMEKDNDPIPEEDVQITVEQGDIAVAITAWMQVFREEMRSKAVKKTLTIPSWMNEAGEEAGINFSQLLQAAIRERLGIQQ